MNKRVYISGPITGVENYREKFKAAADRLTAAGHVVINPAELADVLPVASWGEYMRIDFDLIELAWALVLLPGWETSRGCRAEVDLAEGLGLAIVKLDQILGEG